MLKIFASAALASICATPILAQSTSDSTPLPSAPRPMTTEEVPFVAVSAGFSYLQTDLTDTQGGTGSYQMGWYGIPQVFLTRHISAIADFANFSNWHAGQTDNVHTFLGGPAYSLGPHWGVDPFVFAEGGATRNSTAGAIQWDPAAAGGLGMNFKLTKMVSFQVIPGEYIATKLPNGNWQSNFNAKAGFTFTMSRLRHKKV